MFLQIRTKFVSTLILTCISLVLFIRICGGQDNDLKYFILFPKQILLQCGKLELTQIPFSCLASIFWDWQNNGSNILITPQTGHMRTQISFFEAPQNSDPIFMKTVSLSWQYFYSDIGDLLSQIQVNDLIISGFGTHQVYAEFSFHFSNFSIEGVWYNVTSFFATSQSQTLEVIPGWSSLVPALSTMIFAVILRQVIPALYLGIAFGAFLSFGFNPISALLRPVDYYIPNSLANSERLSIVFFSLLLGGMIGIFHKSGAALSLGDKLSGFANSSYKAQWMVFVLGLLIFFDDYSNALIIGTSMKLVIERLNISYEKFAFLVDSTSAPLCSLSPISSWIGFEIGLIAHAFELIKLKRDPYITFLETIPNRFYPICMLFFVVANLVFGREFGPMLYAERRALEKKKNDLQKQLEMGQQQEVHSVELENISTQKNEEDQVLEEVPEEASNTIEEEKENKKTKEELEKLTTKKVTKRASALTMVIPIVVTVIFVIIALVVRGILNVNELQKQGYNVSMNIQTILSNTDSVAALIIGSFIGNITCMIMARVQKVGTFVDLMEGWNQGVKEMFAPLLLLWFAWALGDVMDEVKAANFIVNSLKSSLTPGLLPFLVTLISGILSFTTGTSWGVMVILFPLCIPLAYAMDPTNEDLLLATIGSILAGSIIGDHCSPIADTTILSSIASGCDLLSHVKTQLPYALVVAFFSTFLGSLPCGMGLYSNWIGNLLAIVGSIVTFWLISKQIEQNPDDTIPKRLNALKNFFLSKFKNQNKYKELEE